MALDALNEIPDETLLVLYANGDPAAARMLTLRLAPLAYRVALRMLGDRSEAEDVAQEAMLRLWRLAPDWRQGEAKVSTWLYRVASNLAVDRIRRRKRGVALDQIEEPLDERPSAAEGMIDSDRLGALEDALGQLPDRQRQAVVLRHLEGMTNPEIADVMQIGVEAVESLTARGKRALSRLLSGRRAELGFDDA